MYVENSSTIRQERRPSFRKFRHRVQFQVNDYVIFQLGRNNNICNNTCLLCSCIFDNLQIYNGSETLDENKIAVLCGNLTDNLPVIKSNSNSMVLKFHADDSRHSAGFSLKVNLNETLLILETRRNRYHPSKILNIPGTIREEYQRGLRGQY